MPLADAKMGVMTHAFNYGTAVFEGIRGNWNAEEQTVYIFRLEDHIKRLFQSARVLRMDVGHTQQEVIDLIVKVVELSNIHEDQYIRPLAYKSSEVLGVRLHDLEDDILIFDAPFGPYLDVDAPIRCMTSSWRRVEDPAIPARIKNTGMYVNSALAKTDAILAGYDEAIMLNSDGHLSEGSGENIVIIRDGKLYTPSRSDNVLEGITLRTVIELAKEMGLETVERSLDRSELYIADEVFLTGTAAHVTAVNEVDNRMIGDGKTGVITKQLQDSYFRIIYGRDPRYARWCTAVPLREAVPQA
jgi:branched-chain amino acid aminotransferase